MGNPTKSGIEAKDIKFLKFVPTQHLTQFGGFLPNTPEACALWYFFTCAHQALAKIEAQVTLEGNEDATADLMQVARSTQMLYELPDLEGMFNQELINTAKRECVRCGLPYDSRLDAFFSSGGKSYRHLDRDPDKVNTQ